jgi:hypothetical protein
MDENDNSTFPGHPFYLPPTIFNRAAWTPFAIAAAFWRPWFTEPGKRKVPVREQSEVPTEDVLQPQGRSTTTKEKPETGTTVGLQRDALINGLSMLVTPEKKGAPATQKLEPEVSRHTKRQQTPKPVLKKVALEKRPKRPTQRTSTEKLQLEQEERAQKTERLRKLRVAKEAAEKRKRPPRNGHAGARSSAKE